MKGAAAPPTTDIRSTLVLRRSAAGEVRVQGDPPPRHVFPTAFIERELEHGAVSVVVVLQTDAGPVRYSMDGFEPLPDGSANVTGWVCTREGEDDRG